MSGNESRSQTLVFIARVNMLLSILVKYIVYMQFTGGGGGEWVSKIQIKIFKSYKKKVTIAQKIDIVHL